MLCMIHPPCSLPMMAEGDITVMVVMPLPSNTCKTPDLPDNLTCISSKEHHSCRRCWVSGPFYRFEKVRLRVTSLVQGPAANNGTVGIGP